MIRAVACVVLAAAASAIPVGAVRSDSRVPSAAGVLATPRDPVVTSNAFLQARLDSIRERSGLWRDATRRVAAEERRVLVVTPDEIAALEPAGLRVSLVDASGLAEVAPVVGPDGGVHVVVVVVNLPLLERAHDRRRSLPAELHLDVDRILIHEVYGHALPYLLAGNISGRCADPAPGQPAVESCAIQRENAVRAELGLGRRVDAGLLGLTLARGGDWR